ncbi:hypothetical protein FQN54_006995 [Arachnomyces sp. PD_36]|nr:hypothetical protein FQN54_006995 [Arachnomyces sp. PD_36]
MCQRTATTYSPCNHTVSRVMEPCSSPGPGCGTTAPDASPAAPAPSEDCPTCKELKEEEASILAELEEAIAANPALKAEAPKSLESQWEDYDEAIANNPDFACPVPTTDRAKKFYSLKEKWECGHEGTPYETGIERDGGENDQEAILISDIRGICPDCMAKWTKLEAVSDDAAGGSYGPPGLPDYNQTWSDNDKGKGHTNPADFSDDDGLPSSKTRFGRETNVDEHDEGPSKGKENANAPAGSTEPPRSPDPYSDGGESIIGSDASSDTPAKPRKQVRIFESDDSEDDGKSGKGKSASKDSPRFDDDSDFDDFGSDDGDFSGSDTNEKIKKKRLSFFSRNKK